MKLSRPILPETGFVRLPQILAIIPISRSAWWAGIWMGGYPPLGYDVKDRQLVINESEAATVRRIFQRFAELRSATELCRELALDGITTKAWKTADGNVRHGTPMDKKYLAKALRNPVYVGELRHKGTVHAGQHAPIITRQLWDRVQAILDEDAHARMGATRTRGKTDALLRGLLYGANGEKYHITFSTKPSGKKYRYYIPKADRRYGRGTSATGMIPADQIEEVVVNLVVWSCPVFTDSYGLSTRAVTG